VTAGDFVGGINATSGLDCPAFAGYVLTHDRREKSRDLLFGKQVNVRGELGYERNRNIDRVKDTHFGTLPIG
jgi:hypothetical protein